MSEQHLELLRSLALRPSLAIASNLKPLVTALRDAGYITCGPDGWIATAEGCRLVQRSHAQATLVRL